MKPLLRLLPCGSVDDGKSTLIGRLLHDCGAVAKDKLEGLTDFSLLADGLEAEREQGITIDGAYLYFASATRRFILSDCPGHEQYTRNMATGASNAELDILLVDARRGLVEQTRPLRKEMDGIDAKLNKLADERTALEAELASGKSAAARIVEVGKRLKAIHDELEAAELRWLELGAEIDAIQAAA